MFLEESFSVCLGLNSRQQRQQEITFVLAAGGRGGGGGAERCFKVTTESEAFLVDSEWFE